MNRGQWELARERSQSPYFRPVRPPKSVCIGEVLDDVNQELGLKESTLLLRLQDAWPTLAGPQISEHAIPGDIRNDCLIIHVSHPIWMVQLQQFGKKEILQRVQAAFPDAGIRELRVQLHHSTSS